MTGLRRDEARAPFTVTTEPREGGRPPSGGRGGCCLRSASAARRGGCRSSSAPRWRPGAHYHLSDVRSFEGKRMVVVGLGDVAMEAAIALGRQPGTEVTVVHRGEEFSRGKARNIAEVRRMRDAGRLAIHVGAEVTAVEVGPVELRTPGGAVRVGATRCSC
jgi:thioredoxin reductase